MPGVLAPLVSVTAVRTVSFSVYQKAKYKASSFIGTVTGKEEPLLVVNKPGSVPDLSTVTCFGMAGAAAGAASTFIACQCSDLCWLIVVYSNTFLGPFELTKNAMVIAKQIAATSVGVNQNPIRISYQDKSTFRTAKQIVSNCGFLGLYSGFQLQMSMILSIYSNRSDEISNWSVVRETFGTAIYFMSYESGKQLLVKYQGVNSPTSPLAVALAGGFCGIIGLVSVSLISCSLSIHLETC